MRFSEVSLCTGKANSGNKIDQMENTIVKLPLTKQWIVPFVKSKVVFKSLFFLPREVEAIAENMKNSENLCTKCKSGCFRFTVLGFCCDGLISPAGLVCMFRFPIQSS